MEKLSEGEHRANALFELLDIYRQLTWELKDRGYVSINIKKTIKEWTDERMSALRGAEQNKHVGPYLGDMRSLFDSIIADYEEDEIAIGILERQRLFPSIFIADKEIPQDLDLNLARRAQYIVARNIVLAIIYMHFRVILKHVGAAALCSAVVAYCCMRWLHG